MVVVLPLIFALAALPFTFYPRGRHGCGSEVGEVGSRSGPASKLLDLAVAADLLQAGISAGASIPSCLTSLGVAANTLQLQTFSQCLIMGVGWPQAIAEIDEPWRELLDVLEPAWTQGVCPQLLLSDFSSRWRANRSRKYREAAAKLAGKLILPLTLCYLPAFVLLAIVPLMWQGLLGLWG